MECVKRHDMKGLMGKSLHSFGVIYKLDWSGYLFIVSPLSAITYVSY